MYGVVGAFWRSAEIDAQRFREICTAELAAAGPVGNGDVEVLLPRRDARGSFGTIGNNPPPPDAWAIFHYPDAAAWEAVRGSAEFRALTATKGGRGAWTTFDEAEIFERRNDPYQAPAEGTAPDGTPYLLFGTVSRHPDLSQDEFIDHYHEVHQKLAMELPGLRRYEYLISTVDPRPTRVGPHRNGQPGIDSYVLLGFDSRAAWNECAESDAMARGVADWDGFIWWVHFEEVEGIGRTRSPTGPGGVAG